MSIGNRSGIAALVLALGQLFAVSDSHAQGTIRGIVNDSLLARAPLQGATVVLQGAPHTAVTDRLGRFVMRDVPAGTYRIGFFHPVLDSLEASAPLGRVVVKDGETAIVALGMPTANSLSLALCGKPLQPSSSVIFGVVRDAERDEPLAGALVRANWYEWVLLNGVGSETERVESHITGEDGRYTLCGVPNDISLTLVATRDGQMTGDLTLSLDHLDIGRRDLMVSASDTAARVPPPFSSADTVPWQRPAGNARLRVTVLSEGGRPVEGATVGVRGTRVNGVTAGDGTLRLVGIPAGSQSLLVRRPGTEPATQQVALRANAENAITVRIGRTVVLLPAVAVTGQRATQLDRDIGNRVTMYNGKRFDDREIEVLTRGGLAGWTKVPGMRVQSDGMDALPLMQNSRMEACAPNLWYNGAHITSWSAWELRTMLIGAKRMEVYPRPANQPPQFLSQNDCGSIIIWS